MKYLSLLFLTLATFFLQAQTTAIDAFVDKYRGLEDATHINMSGGLLNWINEAKTEEGQKTFRSKIESLRIFSVDQVSAIDADDVNTLRQTIYANGYEELIRIRDGKDLVHICIRENRNVIEELVILVDNVDDFTIVSLAGEIYYDDLKEINLDGEAGEALRGSGERP